MLLLFLINFQNQLRPLKTCLVILLQSFLLTHKPWHIFFMATIVRISLPLNVIPSCHSIHFFKFFMCSIGVCQWSDGRWPRLRKEKRMNDILTSSKSPQWSVGPNKRLYLEIYVSSLRTKQNKCHYIKGNLKSD